MNPLDRLTVDRLSSADPRERSQAARALIARLDISSIGGARPSCLIEKENQDKHIITGEASPLERLGAHELCAVFCQLTASAQVALLRALSSLSLEGLEALEREVKLITLALKLETPKVRQAAAQLLSERPILSDALLLSSLEAEEVYFVRASLILALGRSTEPGGAARLQAWERSMSQREGGLGAREREALLKAYSALSLADQRQARAPLRLTRPSLERALIWCAPLGLEDALSEELSADDYSDLSPWRLSPDSLASGQGLVLASPSPLTEPYELSEAHALARPRCAEGLALLIASGRPSAHSPRAQRLSALLSAAQSAAAQPLPLSPASLSEPLRYRIELPIKDRAERRRLLLNCRALMAERFPGSIESPSDYQAQLIPRFGDWDSLLLRLDALSSPRGFARLADVGASMSQPVAAAVARLSARCRAAKPAPTEPPVIFDPTCGSGALIIERALLSPRLNAGMETRLIGQDLSKLALRVSLQNHERLIALRPELAGRLSFQRGDSGASPWPRFDEALMNLPFGLRVTGARGQRAQSGELEQLYEGVFVRAAEAAQPHATLTCYSAQRALMERAAQAAGWRPLSSRRVWAGGLLVHLVCYARP